MNKLKLTAFTVILGTVIIATNVNASKIEALKETEHRAEEALVDTMITAKIKTLLLNEPELSATKIHVTTINQVVILTGEVETEFEEKIARNLSESVKEVKAVHSELKIALC